MNPIMQAFWLMSPEIFLLSITCTLIFLDLFLKKTAQSSYYIKYAFVQVGILVTIVLCWATTPSVSPLLDEVSYMALFSDQFRVDTFSQIIKMTMLCTVFFVLIYSRAYVAERKIAAGEYQFLILFSTIGMMCLASANSLLMIYLGLELLSLPLYALVALNRESSLSVEAGMKYFIMGSLASGLLLYGLSLLFGLSGTLVLPEIAAKIWTAQSAELGLYLFSLLFIIVSISFKFGGVPFHMWIPDVYQGAATSVTMLLSSAPKIAAFALAYRLLADALPDLSFAYGTIFVVLGLLSLMLGNIIAIAQTNLKRMLGYSTISHVGFILLGIATGSIDAYYAVSFYVMVYVILALGAFATIVVLSPAPLEAEHIDDFKGLAQRNPWIAFLMMIFLFSFAGIPPTAGFYAKFMILKSLIDVQLTWVAGIAVLFSVIGAFYYLRVIKCMYFDKPSLDTKGHVILDPVAVPLDAQLALSVNGLAVLALGIFPGPLLWLCAKMLNIES